MANTAHAMFSRAIRPAGLSGLQDLGRVVEAEDETACYSPLEEFA